MAENKLINKLMLICHAQVYFVHDTAVELQPTVQTLLVYETLPEKFPTEIFKIEELGVSRDDDVRIFSLEKPIGKALYDIQKWIDYTSTTGKHCCLHMTNIIYFIQDTKLDDIIYYQPVIHARFNCPYCSSELFFAQATYAYYTDEGTKFDTNGYCYCHYCKMPFLYGARTLNRGTLYFEVEKYSLADAKRIAFKVPDIAEKHRSENHINLSHSLTLIFLFHLKATSPLWYMSLRKNVIVGIAQISTAQTLSKVIPHMFSLLINAVFLSTLSSAQLAVNTS